MCYIRHQILRLVPDHALDEAGTLPPQQRLECVRLREGDDEPGSQCDEVQSRERGQDRGPELDHAGAEARDPVLELRFDRELDVALAADDQRFPGSVPVRVLVETSK